MKTDSKKERQCGIYPFSIIFNIDLICLCYSLITFMQEDRNVRWMQKRSSLANGLCLFLVFAAPHTTWCTYTHTHTYACTHMHTHMHIHEYTSTHTYTHTHAHTHTHTHTHTQTHTHIHTNTHTHVRTQGKR